MINKKAFTLVELIVVITILAILGTIAFLSFQGYSQQSRDTLRVSDIKSIEKGLEFMLTKSGRIPLPDDNIELFYSGTLIGYQGDAAENTLSTIQVHKGGKDPSTGEYYTYSINENLTKYQILGFLENNISVQTINQAVADNNNKEIYTRGSELGILLQTGSLIPIHKESSNIDIATTTQELVVYTNNISSDIITGDSDILKNHLKYRFLKESSCNAILKNGNSKGDGYYTLTGENNNKYDAYCDMTTDGGGWTYLISVNPAGTTWDYDSIQWQTPSYTPNFTQRNIFNTETTSQAYGNTTGDKIKICRKDLDHCYTFDHNMGRTLQSFYVEDVTYTQYSECDVSSSTYCGSGQLPERVGINDMDKFQTSLGLIKYVPLSTYPKRAIGINIHEWNKIGAQSDNNNIYPMFDNNGIGIGVFRAWNCGHKDNVQDYSRARSVGINTACAYEDPDTEMWYIYTK